MGWAEAVGQQVGEAADGEGAGAWRWEVPQGMPIVKSLQAQDGGSGETYRSSAQRTAKLFVRGSGETYRSSVQRTAKLSVRGLLGVDYVTVHGEGRKDGAVGLRHTCAGRVARKLACCNGRGNHGTVIVVVVLYRLFMLLALGHAWRGPTGRRGETRSTTYDAISAEARSSFTGLTHMRHRYTVFCRALSLHRLTPADGRTTQAKGEIWVR